MRIVVTGGRDYADRSLLYRVLDLLAPTRVAQGGARGADALAAEWCAARAAETGVDSVTYPAQWAEHGKRAGALRNAEMLAAEKPDLVLAFPGGRGTGDCTRRARELGIVVLEVRP